MIVTMPSGRKITAPTGMTIREAFQYARAAEYALGEIETAATRPNPAPELKPSDLLDIPAFLRRQAE